MKLEAGSVRLLRLEAVTALHLGRAAGEATLDRPVQKDVHTGLPFLPDSTLKGVLAGRFGNVPDDRENSERERRFGSPDRPPRNGGEPSFGRPSPILLGNGELLAFPVPSRPGPAWIFPALTLAWALRFEPAAAAPAGVLPLLAEIEREGGKAFAWPALPRLDTPLAYAPLAVGLQETTALLGLLRRLAGPSLPADTPLVILSSQDAGHLWPSASDRRVLTALDSSTRTVAGGALRRIEMIPPGALFLSLVTCEPDGPAAGGFDLDAALFQVGAWESLGLGWVHGSTVEPDPAPQTPAPGPATAAGHRFDPSRVMVEAHQAVRRLITDAEPPLRRAIRSATRHFGGRAQFSGLEAAFAFELAKAKPAHREPSKDARAHRWLLANLLGLGSEPPAPRGASAPLLAWLATDPFAPGTLAADRDLFLNRWLWLARYLEVDPEAGSEEEEP